MSLSKGKAPAAAGGPQRQPKCTRCRHHGLIVPQKGHVKLCPFLRCSCPKCLLVTERTRITTLQRNLSRAEDTRLKNNSRRPGPEAASAASALAAGAPPLAQSSPELRSAAGTGACVAGSVASATASPSTEQPRNLPRFSVPYFGELRPSAPVPFIHFPFRMSGHYPSSYVPCPAFTINMPRVPAAQYNHGLYRPLMFPHFQDGAEHYPPLPQPRPPADYKPAFFTLQPTPLGPDIVELD